MVDSLKLYEELQEAQGDPLRTARAVAEFVTVDAVATKTDNAGLHADIAALRAASRLDLDALRAELSTEIANRLRAAARVDLEPSLRSLQHRLVQWLLATAMVSVAVALVVFAALLQLLH